jgi:hypothetical protein
MTKRLQVLFEDDELAEIQRFAQRRGQTTADFVRAALRDGMRAATAYPDPEPKLRAVREALTYAYPTAEVDVLNAEIERGYLEADRGRAEPADT